ncbi:MAG: hypothetical protein AAFS10_06625 [Myxococcota bacterium]
MTTTTTLHSPLNSIQRLVEVTALVGVTLLMMTTTGCSDDSYSNETSSTAVSCGDTGDQLQRDDDAVCVFGQELLIENGFSCPPGLDTLTEFGPIGICSDGPLDSGELEWIAREHRDRSPARWDGTDCIANSECETEQVCDMEARCTAPPPTCPEGQMQVADSSECLQDDAICYELSPGVWCTGPDGNGFTCDSALSAYTEELSTIQSCTTDAECGQPLTGTSCGCTRNLVARNDADTTRFYELQRETVTLGCDLGSSTCDCPEADGFICDAGVCNWNYTQ